MPIPPPSQPLLESGFKIGQSVATGVPVGVDPDGHSLATHGSRSGKSSFVFAMLEPRLACGDDAPGIFRTDPHVSMADAFLDAIAELPEVPKRNAIVQVSRRIWNDYWGPHMPAALLGLFGLAHVWNQNYPEAEFGLLHVVFTTAGVLYNVFDAAVSQSDLEEPVPSVSSSMKRRRSVRA